jgi:hypothetical protein
MINVTATAGIAIITAKRVLTAYTRPSVISFAIIIISIGHRNQEHGINLSLVNSAESVYIRKERVTKKGISDTHEEGISTQKHKYKVLRIASEIDFPKVRTFLESVARGSINSKGSYEIGLKHLQCFLSSNNNNNGNDYQHQNYYNIETIVLALQSNTINVYALLDSFVSYLVHVPRQLPIRSSRRCNAVRTD